MVCATAVAMAPRKFQELRCWQIANQLRGEVNEICSIPKVAKDCEFCDSFRGTAGSVCRNMAEGFTRFASAHIVQFFGYALASIGELEDHLEECRTRAFVDQTKYEQLTDRAEHAKASALKFIRPHVEKLRSQKTTRRRKRPE